MHSAWPLGIPSVAAEATDDAIGAIDAGDKMAGLHIGASMSSLLLLLFIDVAPEA